MKKGMKKPLSMCLCMAVTATVVPFNCLSQKASCPNGTQKSADIELISETEDYIVDSSAQSELFSSLKFDEENSKLVANGVPVGTSFGGVTVSDGELLVDVDGEQLPFRKAQAKIGCIMEYDEKGNDVIYSPFQTARLIVKAEQDFDPCGAEKVEEKFEHHFLLTFSSQTAAYEAYQKLMGDEKIDYVEPDAVYTVMETAPDESKRIDSWGLEKIGANEYCAWLKGEKEELPEVDVAVIDTGIYYDHHEFSGRILDGGMSFVEGDDRIPDDKHGHGSHCSGIICSSTNDNVKILPVQVLSEEGYGTTMDIYLGMMYAIEQDVDVMSMSLGGYGKSNLFDEAVLAAYNKGITVCVAAGNEAYDSEETFGSLSRNDKCVVVSSVDAQLNVSDFSNYGMIDFAAPGEDIESVGIEGEDDTVAMSGTSMATPFVAAAFADVLSYDKDMTAEQAYNYLKANAIDIDDRGFDRKTGWGLINLADFSFTQTRVEMPYPSVNGGTFSEEFEIELSSSTEKAEIYYTLDGTAATPENGIKYDGKPLKIDSSVRVNMVAVFDGNVSHMNSVYYVISDVEDSNSFVIENGVLKTYSGSRHTLDIAKMVEDGILPEITSVGEAAFRGNEYIEEVILPDTVTSIGKFAFYECTNLEKVDCNAEMIADSAFRSCVSLEAFTSKKIRSVGNFSFNSCSSLKEFDGKKLKQIPVGAFTLCRKLTEENFDISSIYDFGVSCFSYTGISGKIDLSSADSIGMDSFSSSKIEEVILPGDMKEIPDSLFLKCSELRKISAPSVKSIGYKALALGKNEFTADTVVETDIDFSKVTFVDDKAFQGYVFDKPVSFDSIGEDTPLTAFGKACGEAVYLPTIKKIVSFVENGSDGCSNDFNINTLYLENAEEISNNAFNKFNVVVLGDGVKKIERGFIDDYYDESEYTGVICMTSENEKVRKACETNKIKCADAPFIYSRNENYLFYVGDEDAKIRAFSVGEGCRGEWYSADAESGEETKLDISPVYDMKIDTSKADVFNYVYKQFDADGNIINEKEIKVDVIGYDTKTIRADEYYDLEFSKIKEAKDKKTYIDLLFTPEKTDTYTFYTDSCNIDVYEGDKCNASFEIGFISDEESGKHYIGLIEEMELKAGVTYRLRAIGSGVDSFICVRSSDASAKPIGILLNVQVNGSDEPGSVPEVIIKDGAYELKENVDYELTFDDTVSDEYLLVNIKGIGNYFGSMQRYYFFKTWCVKDRYYDLIDREDGYPALLYRPEEDEALKIVSKPLQEDLDKAIQEGRTLSEFYPGIDVYSPETDELPSITISPFRNVYATDYYYTSTNDGAVCCIPAIPEREFHFSPMYSSMQMLLTTGDTIADCKVEYDLNHEYDGKPVVPNVKVTGKNGEELVEGKDYKLTFWHNDKPGLMYGYLESFGKYPGAMPLVMSIDNPDVKVVDYEGSHVIDLTLGSETDVVSEFMYKFDCEEDGIYKIDSPMAESLLITVGGLKDGKLVDTFYGDEQGVFLKKGSYLMIVDYAYFEMNERDDPTVFSINKSDEMFPLTKADITVSDCTYSGKKQTPEIKVTYDGKELTADTDYTADFSIRYSEVGVYEVTISGKGAYAGEVTKTYRINPDESCKTAVLKDGANQLETVKPDEAVICEWIPEKTNYQIVSSSLGETTLAIFDKDNNLVYSGSVDRKTVAEFEAVPNEKYTVWVSTFVKNKYELDFRTEGFLGDCDIQYEKAMKLTGDETYPEVTFKDGDYTLVEGTDYKLVNDGFINDIGRLEFVYEGIGKYFGDVCLPVISYKENPFGDDVWIWTEMFPSFVSSIDYYGTPGQRKYYKVTSTADGIADYHITLTNKYGSESEYLSVIAYDKNGKFIGVNEDVTDFSLKKGETYYFIVVNPYTYDTDEQVDSLNSVVRLDLVGVREPSPLEARTLGDVNCDGMVNIFDVVILNNYLVGNRDLTEQGKINAEVTTPVLDAAKAELSMADSDAILKAVVELVELTDEGVVSR